MASRHGRFRSAIGVCILVLATACSGDPPGAAEGQAGASGTTQTAPPSPQIGDWESKTYPVSSYAWDDGQLLLIAHGPDVSAARSGAVRAESATEVRVSMTLWVWRASPGAYEFPVLRARAVTVRTAQPLGSRAVVDATIGKAVPRASAELLDALRRDR